ncbi:MAG: hypothetical protein IJT24_01565, partial [Lachnospiraceae bacterium]|nr:hypothetical protein [Lachnospiraceae bacterium]
MKKNIFITAILIMALLSAGCGIEGKNNVSFWGNKTTERTGTGKQETAAGKKSSQKAQQEKPDEKYKDMHLKLT